MTAIEKNGVLLLNKPLGLSSNKALQICKRLVNAKKAGHTGSLDPLATGMLPICFGEATKFSQYLLSADKTYTVTAQFGQQTTTGDAEGDVIAEVDVPSDLSAKLAATIPTFIGDILQVPPMFSALKHQGQPLYKLARRGEVIDRPARPVTIHALQLTDLSGSQASFRVHCSKGTYIRTLIEDIGRSVGCGAHVATLHREGVAGFDSEQMSTLDTLRARSESGEPIALLPLTVLLSHLPTVDLSLADTLKLLNGVPISLESPEISGEIVLISPDKGFMGIGEVVENAKIAPKRLISTEKLRKSLSD